MYELEINYGKTLDWIVEAFGDDIYYSASEPFEDIMVKITKDIDVSPYIDIEFFKEFFDDSKWSGKPGYENNEEIREDIRYWLSTQPQAIYKEFDDWEDYLYNDMLHKILNVIGYEIALIGGQIAELTYAFYPEGKRDIAQDLWDGTNIYDFDLLDENGDVLHSTTRYLPDFINDQDVDDVLSDFGVNANDLIITGELAKYLHLNKYRIEK